MQLMSIVTMNYCEISTSPLSIYLKLSVTVSVLVAVIVLFTLIKNSPDESVFFVIDKLLSLCSDWSSFSNLSLHSVK